MELKPWPYHFRKTGSLAIPVMLNQASHVMVSFADNVMVGQTGDVNALASCSLGNGLFSTILMFCIGISYGLTPKIAEANGRRDFGSLSLWAGNSLAINLLTGVALFLVLWLATPLMYQLDQPVPVVDQAIPYSILLGCSIVPIMLFQTYRSLAEGLSDTRVGMYAALAGNLINVGLNYLFIFGHWGFAAMGLMGAGYATLISRILMPVMLLILFQYRPTICQLLKPIHQFRLNGMYVKALLAVGLPISFQFLCEVAAFTFAGFMCGWAGAEALAAHQIAINLASITYMMATGISSAATIQVGYFKGAGDWANLRRSGFSAFLLTVVFMSATAGLLITFRSQLIGLYATDEKVVELAMMLVAVAAVFQLGDGLQVTGLGCLRGLSDVNIPSLVTLIAYWGLSIPLGYILFTYSQLHVQGVWLGLTFGLYAVSLALFIRFWRKTSIQ